VRNVLPLVRSPLKASGVATCGRGVAEGVVVGAVVGAAGGAGGGKESMGMAAVSCCTCAVSAEICLCIASALLLCPSVCRSIISFHTSVMMLDSDTSEGSEGGDAFAQGSASSGRDMLSCAEGATMCPEVRRDDQWRVL
jgi:hypothetical protein